MKKFRLVLLLTIVGVGFLSLNAFSIDKEIIDDEKGFHYEASSDQQINMFISHGHCSSPFSAKAKNLKIQAPYDEDLGNPLEGMKINFEIAPESFVSCYGNKMTKIMQTPGVFVGEHNESLLFKSKNVYTMGLDWYQVNGSLSIKGEERDVVLFATGIRAKDAVLPTSLVLEGKMDLSDWGIDYDLIVNGKSDDVPTKWFYINMRLDI